MSKFRHTQYIYYIYTYETDDEFIDQLDIENMQFHLKFIFSSSNESVLTIVHCSLNVVIFEPFDAIGITFYCTYIYLS